MDLKTQRLRPCFQGSSITHGKVLVKGDEVVVKTTKKAHKPILKSLEVFQKGVKVPWWGNKKLEFE